MRLVTAVAPDRGRISPQSTRRLAQWPLLRGTFRSLQAFHVPITAPKTVSSPKQDCQLNLSPVQDLLVVASRPHITFVVSLSNHDQTAPPQAQGQRAYRQLKDPAPPSSAIPPEPPETPCPPSSPPPGIGARVRNQRPSCGSQKKASPVTLTPKVRHPERREESPLRWSNIPDLSL